MANSHTIDLDDQIVALATAQHGLVTRAQLLELGLGTDAVTHRCQKRSLFRVHLGVYSLGHPPKTPLERAAAAVLACGPDAALSHSSALTLWGLDRRWHLPFHVMSPDRRRRPGISSHRVKNLTRADIRIQLGIRVTSPARTFLDCAPSLPRKRLFRTMADARRSGHLHIASLTDVLDRNLHHPGRIPILNVLDGLGNPTRSEFEDVFLAFCQRHGLPTPLTNVIVNGREVDAYFEAEGVIVELDGWSFHRDRHVFESDRDRDSEALAAGLVTYRLTWERQTQHAEREARRLHTVLAGRRAAGISRSSSSALAAGR